MWCWRLICCGSSHGLQNVSPPPSISEAVHRYAYVYSLAMIYLVDATGLHLWDLTFLFKTRSGRFVTDMPLLWYGVVACVNKGWFLLDNGGGDSNTSIFNINLLILLLLLVLTV